ncbi:MAG: acyltransferase family protein [Salinivirgaceae bacterium]|nr:acyltransferase family protein [Salinivirgaceae bacterium]
MKWNFSTNPITKEQTSYIKGVGILLIVLHNFLHWVGPNPGENEFDFAVSRGNALLNQLVEMPTEFLNILFSYFGHFGVQLFIFMSGYGLALSFMNFKGSNLQYIKSRITKIYPTFLIGIFVLLVYLAYTRGGFPNMDWWTQMSYKLLMINNWMPDEALSINGPWWFYSLIFQLYLLFPFVFYCIKRWNSAGFIVMSVASYALIFSTFQPLMHSKLYIMANAPGHIPEFALGIFLALNPKIRINIWFIVLSVIAFIWGNIHFSGFPFTFLAISLLMFALFQRIFKRRKNALTQTHYLVFYGNLSMYLFAVHGFFRPQIIGLIQGGPWWIKLFYALVFLLITTGVALSARSLHSSINNLIFNTKNQLTHLVARDKIAHFIQRYRLGESLKLLARFFIISILSVAILRVAMMLYTSMDNSSANIDFLHLYYGLLRDLLVCARWFVLLIIPAFLFGIWSKVATKIFLYSTTLPLIVLTGILSYFFLKNQVPLEKFELTEIAFSTISSLWGFLFIGLGLISFLVWPRNKTVPAFTSFILLITIVVAGFTPKPWYINPPKTKFQSEKLYYQAVNYAVHFVDHALEEYALREEKLEYSRALSLIKEDFPQFGASDLEFPLVHNHQPNDTLRSFFEARLSQPNFVFILIPEICTEYSGLAANALSVTPFLDSIARKGLYWPNCLALTTEITHSLPTIFSSVLSGGDFMAARSDMPNHTSLMTIAESFRYKSSVFFGGDAEHNGMLHYLPRNKTILPLTNRNPNVEAEAKNEFGYLGWHDLELIERRLENNWKTDSAPFIDIYVTSSSKFPYTYPDKEKWQTLLRQHLINKGIGESTISSNLEYLTPCFLPIMPCVNYMRPIAKDRTTKTPFLL